MNQIDAKLCNIMFIAYIKKRDENEHFRGFKERLNLKIGLGTHQKKFELTFSFLKDAN